MYIQMYGSDAYPDYAQALLREASRALPIIGAAYSSRSCSWEP